MKRKSIFITITAILLCCVGWSNSVYAQTPISIQDQNSEQRDSIYSKSLESLCQFIAQNLKRAVITGDNNINSVMEFEVFVDKDGAIKGISSDYIKEGSQESKHTASGEAENISIEANKKLVSMYVRCNLQVLTETEK